MNQFQHLQELFLICKIPLIFGGGKGTLWFCQIQNPPLVSHFAEHALLAVFIEHSAQLNFSSKENPIYLLTNMISPATKIQLIF